MRAKFSRERGLRFGIPRAEKSDRWREHFFTFYSFTGGGAVLFPAHTRTCKVNPGDAVGRESWSSRYISDFIRKNALN